MNGLKRIQDFLATRELDAMVLLSPVNLHYFAGFTGTTAVAFILREAAYVITDSRYTEQAAQQCENYRVIQYKKSPWETIQEIIERSTLTIRRCGFEGNAVTFDQYALITKALSDFEWVSVTLESLRAVKRPDELDKMRQAAKIADEALAAMLPQLRVGMTENDARIILETEMLKRGSSEPSFATIVASGMRSSMPHGVASDKVIEKGDFITFDFGAVYQGYHSDMTRTIVMGKASDLQKELYDLVLKAQKAGVAAVKEGLTGKELDAICRDIISDAGYGEYFQHGLGHGVGLEIHELPVASPKSNHILEKNMIVTVEPGVYLPGQLGLRIEDSVIVTPEGCEILTKTSKELIEIEV